MGLADLIFGTQNPFSQFVDTNQNKIAGIGAGLASGQNISAGLAAAAQGAQQGGAADRSYAIQVADQKARLDQIAYERTLQQNALALQVNQRKYAANWAIQNKHPELAGPLMSGAIDLSNVFDLINKQTVVPFGSSVINGQGQTVAGGDTTSGFGGTDLKSQAYNTLLQGQNNPALRNTPKYRAAYAIATEPTMTPQGMMQPNIPASWAPDAAPQASVPSPLPTVPQGNGGGVGSYGSDTAPIGSLSNAPQSGFQSVSGAAPQVLGPGVIAGTAPFNESQARTTMLTQSAIPDLKRVIDLFPALLNTKDQLAQGVQDSGIPGAGIARLAQSPGYKQAHDALTSAIGNVLYVASGANLNAGELQRKVDAYTPSIGDDPQTAANKLDRFSNDVVALANNTKDPATIQWAQQALQDLQATKAKLFASQPSGGGKPLTGQTSTGANWSFNP